MAPPMNSRLIQVTNIAPSATKDHMRTLFAYIGRIDELKIFPPDESPLEVSSRVCYVRYDSATDASTACHLTNTVFIDRAIIIVPVEDGRIPDEATAMFQAAPPGTVAGVLPTSSTWPLTVVNQVIGTSNGQQIIMTRDPELTKRGLPPYPPLPATMDATKIDEIRRTVMVENLAPTTMPDQLMTFFTQVGEIKYVRMAGMASEVTRTALIEFSAQQSVPTALTYNGGMFNGRTIKVSHSGIAIIKPMPKMEVPNKEVEEAMKKVKEAQSLISGAVESEYRAGNVDGKRRKTRSRSRSPRRRRSRSRSRRDRSRDRRRRSGSRGAASKQTDRPRRRSRTPRRRSRTRSPPRRRSRSRSRRRSRSPRRRRSRSKSRRPPKAVENKRRSRRSRSRSPRRKRSRSGSKPKTPAKNGSASPEKKKSPSPKRSPKRKSSRSPKRSKRRSRSRSPKRRRSRSDSRSRKNRKDRKRSRSRDRKKKDRTTPEPAEKTDVKRDYDAEEKGFEDDTNATGRKKIGPATPPDIKKEMEEARASEAVKTEPPEEPTVAPVEVKPEPPPMPPSSPPSPPKEAPPSGPSPGRSPKVKKEITQDMDMDSSDD